MKLGDPTIRRFNDQVILSATLTVYGVLRDNRLKVNRYADDQFLFYTNLPKGGICSYLIFSPDGQDIFLPIAEEGAASKFKRILRYSLNKREWKEFFSSEQFIAQFQISPQQNFWPLALRAILI